MTTLEDLWYGNIRPTENVIDTIGNPTTCPKFKNLTYSQAIEFYHYPKKLSEE